MTFFQPYNYSTVQTFLLMADSAYQGAKKASYNGWTTNLPKKLPSVLTNGTYFKGPHDAEAKVFYKNGEITVAFCGTNSTTDQLYVDRDIKNGHYPKSYTDLFKPLISAILKAYGNDTTINLTGHSLGGAVVNDMVARAGQFGIKHLGTAIAYSSPYVIKNGHVHNYGNDNDQIFKYLQPHSHFANTTDHLKWIGDSPNAPAGDTPHTDTEDYSEHILKSLKSTFARMGQSLFDDDMKPDSTIYAMGFNRAHNHSGFHTFDAGAPHSLYNTMTVNSNRGQETFILGVDATTKKHQITPDFLTGGKGVDHIEGFAGNDVLNGAGGRDHVAGGKGNDFIIAGNGDTVYSGIGHDVIDLKSANVKVTTENARIANGAGHAPDFIFDNDGGTFNWARYVKDFGNHPESRATIGGSVKSVEFKYDSNTAPSADLTLRLNEISDRDRKVKFDLAGGDDGRVTFVGGGDADHNNTLIFRNFGASDNRFVFKVGGQSVYKDIDKVVMKDIDFVLKHNIKDYSDAEMTAFTTNHLNDWVLARTSDHTFTAYYVSSITNDLDQLVESASFRNLSLHDLVI
ncbi:MAG: hypothetical protein H6873_03135 [Hyphomicrobiaceae bacterium]|nr:hypothetical protein [Hyphomicrobiaceae bacterium]